MIIDTQIVQVNSKNRNSGSDARAFGFSISNLKRKDFNNVAVLQFNMFKSYYLLDSNSNSFILSEDGGSSRVTLTAGNYNKTTLLAELKTQLDAAGAATYTCTFSSSTGLLTITYAGGGVVNVDLIFSSDTQPAQCLGFVPGTTYSFAGASLTSPNIVNVQREATLLLHCDRVKDGLLQELYCYESVDFGTIAFQNSDPSTTARELIGSGEQFYFTISDEDNAEINPLHGGDAVFSLLFYKKVEIKTKLLAGILENMM